MIHTYQQQYEPQESTINSDVIPPRYPYPFLNPIIILLFLIPRPENAATSTYF